MRRKKKQEEPVKAVAEVEAIAPEVEVVYSFPSRSRCEVCHSIDTWAKKTDDGIQLRGCRSCGRGYKVVGRRV